MSMSHSLKAMSHGAIFFAIPNTILLLRDVKNLANTSLHCILLMCSLHMKQSTTTLVCSYLDKVYGNKVFLGNLLFRIQNEKVQIDIF